MDLPGCVIFIKNGVDLGKPQPQTSDLGVIWGGVAGSFKLKLKTDLKNKFETGKPHLEKPNVICHHLVVFIQHDPSELRGL